MKPTPRSIGLDLVLTVLCCGAWNLVVQYKQIEALNYLLKEERYSFWKMSLLSLLTCGIYFFFHEYRKAQDIGELTGKDRDSDSILALVLCFFALNIIYDAIAQEKINTLLAREGAVPPL